MPNAAKCVHGNLFTASEKACFVVLRAACGDVWGWKAAGEGSACEGMCTTKKRYKAVAEMTRCRMRHAVNSLGKTQNAGTYCPQYRCHQLAYARARKQLTGCAATSKQNGDGRRRVSINTKQHAR